MTAPSQSKRINEILLGYWQSKCAGRPFPLESDINPDDLDAIWDSCFLVKVEAGASAPEYRYVYLGQSLVEAYGDDLTNREVCERLVYPSNMSLVHKFGEIVEAQKPAIEDNEFTNTKGLVVKFRSCMCPLSKREGGGVDYIVGGMKWKAF